MNKVWKKKILTALRSGKYRQTRGQLRGEFGFCCLGVMYDVVAPDEWNKDWKNSWKHGTDGFMLPDIIRTELGLTWVQHDELTSKNDNSKWNFKKIADLIETY
jgi:hypothetical protein